MRGLHTSVIMRSRNLLIRHFLHPLSFGSLIISVACFLSSIQSAAWATTENIILNISLYGSTQQQDLITQAESLVNFEITQQFSQKPDLTDLEITVLSHRNGDVVPILSTRVSRGQWQQTPQVSTWTQYYAFYPLFARHDQPQSGAPVIASASYPITNELSSTLAVDTAYDEGRLSGAEAQRFLDEL
jgi:hypothetical protein